MSRLLPNIRREQIINAGLKVVRRAGFEAVSRESIAKQADCSPSLVRYYLRDQVGMCRAIAQAAEAKGMKRITSKARALGFLE